MPNADHSMLKKNTAAAKWRTNLTAIFFLRALFDDKFLSDLSEFVKQMAPKYIHEFFS
ncbi:hypothetical protein [Paenibacillus pabuli]|uniref:hypothetical protein n=1 Tax=Paenibacillus pabuli TaxID=1472 RepID=UPI003CF31458